MRLWSLHPQYLDAKGLVALWREALLAKNVLEGKTTGYRSHPQLHRFRRSVLPIDGINQYLSEVYQESLKRGYKFDREKIDWNFTTTMLPVTSGQMQYEREHLLKKLKMRDSQRYMDFLDTIELKPHPMFYIVEGEVEVWEMIR